MRGATGCRGGYPSSQGVSIHAPRAGCDRASVHPSATRTSFNSRTPCGVRQLPPQLLAQPEKFQFTHPVRGATVVNNFGEGSTIVSIHAPRAGCDILITWNYFLAKVSIHAPRAGCDNRQYVVIYGLIRFNSRTPCGVRLPRYLAMALSRKFQFTHPVRGATVRLLDDAHTLQVSIHAPRAGCDLDISGVSRVSDVSIHAPRAGCDNLVVVEFLPKICFNSRTPCGVRQYVNYIKEFFGVVSIHAPRAGCDIEFLFADKR